MKSKSKNVIITVVTVLVAAALMMISSEFVAGIGNSGNFGTLIFWGCLGAVVIPLAIAFLAAFYIQHIWNKKQNRVRTVIAVIIAVFCAVFGCVLEARDLMEIRNYFSEIDMNNAMSVMQMAYFQPRFVYFVKVLTIFPAVAKFLL